MSMTSNVPVPLSVGGNPRSSLDNTDINEEFKRRNKKFLRIIVSGRYLEAYWSDKPVMTKRVLLTKPHPRKKRIAQTPEQKEENRLWSIRRAKDRARRLALTNFDPTNAKLLTLTFAPTTQFDVTSPNDCHPKFKNYMDTLKRHYPKFKYIATGEYQMENNRMAVHYHLLTNLPYVKQARLQELWGHGIVDIRLGNNDPRSKITYITKYITKDNPYVFKNHRYFASKFLKKPLTLYGDYAQKLLEKAESLGYTPGYKSSYPNAFLGDTDYTLYNPPTKPPAQEEIT
jgi:hypothetical protein